MYITLHDLAVLCAIASPLVVFSVVLYALIEMYDSRPPSQIIREWWAQQQRRDRTRLLERGL